MKILDKRLNIYGSDNDSYHSESEFYYADEENMPNARARCETDSVKNQHKYLKYFPTEKKNKHVICRPRSVHIGKKNCGLGFSQYGPLGRQITYMYCRYYEQLLL